MSENQKYIDGSWYDESYKNGRYADIYKSDFPEWARQFNLYHVGQVLSWLGLAPWPQTPRVLELGCGVGRYQEAWKAYECAVNGIEISKEACGAASRAGHSVHCRSASDLSLLGDKTFALCFSAAFMEHIDRSITPDVVRESVRVATYVAHVIPLDKGDDPSHIHIQSTEDWLAEFDEILGDGFRNIAVPNLLEPSQPFYFTCPKDKVPVMLQRMAKQ